MGIYHKDQLSFILLFYGNSSFSHPLSHALKANTFVWLRSNSLFLVLSEKPCNPDWYNRGVVILPGGGYQGLAYDWKGTDIAKWFNSKGITAFVLKYLLPISDSVIEQNEAPLQDAKRAIRTVRVRAENLSINPDNIGVMGFSAGGHLASTLGTHFNHQEKIEPDSINLISARPDFMILIYPVITMKELYTHLGSRNNLLGENPSDEMIEHYSNETQVTKNTPPTFLLHTTDDDVVPVENSLTFYKALKEKGHLPEMHIYPEGGHGFALAIGNEHLQNWTDRLNDWLQTINLQP